MKANKTHVLVLMVLLIVHGLLLALTHSLVWPFILFSDCLLYFLANRLYRKWLISASVLLFYLFWQIVLAGTKWSNGWFLLGLGIAALVIGYLLANLGKFGRNLGVRILLWTGALLLFAVQILSAYKLAIR